jgi:hypothetical protein
VVIRVRPEAYRASFPVLAAEIDRVVAQLLSWQATELGPPSVLDRPPAQESDGA